MSVRSPWRAAPAAAPGRVSRPGAGRGENDNRIVRMLARLVSVGYLAYLALLTPAIIAESARMDPWWPPITVAAVFGLGLLPGVLSFRSDTRLMRATAAAAAMAFLIAAATWWTAWNGPDLDPGDAFWLAAFPGLASLAALIAWPLSLAAAYLVLVCSSTSVIVTAARGGSAIGLLPSQIAFGIMFCALYFGGAAMAIRTVKLLDSTTETTYRAAATAAAQRAQTVERERIDALIHDNVLSTFLAAGRGQPHMVVGPLAASTLAELDALQSRTGPRESFSAEEAITHLRNSAAEADDRATFTVSDPTALHPKRLSADDIRTVGSALSEALRNSRQHAGVDARRAVTVQLTDAVLSIDVIDDGAGFDPSAVPPHRLGIAVSIVGRMGSLPGGSASVQSSPGSGTRIHLEWSLR
ncbi:sensor histidine kinase [Gordonia rubripertincta]|uniref:ATP-binding protein n=1 Tax=Gordonia rubripertincta TaxID=36822 RepID=A0ABT4MYP5_GORRU|nr:ATP-binding protein [Gordonia rubripertincta]MCZ4551845.1 ATP-binding protein [Gordonia rubripertincta]